MIDINMKYKKVKKNRLKKLYDIFNNTIIAEAARVYYIITKKFIKKEIWIIGETENQAQDNGFYLFSWIRKNHPEMEVYYVISKSSPELDKIKGIGNILTINSFKQSLYLYQASKIISTHGLWMIPNELGILKNITRKTLKAKGVMLNHGVTAIKNGFKHYNKKTFPLNSLMISVSSREKRIFTEIYGYKESEVAITGYPRHDDLVDTSNRKSSESKMITIMPTFRDNQDNIGVGFKNTKLFNALSSLLSNENLLRHLENENINISLYLHQNIQKYSDMLKKYESKYITIHTSSKTSVKELLKKSNLLISDYSSVMFDFLYMSKPFISYQFDRNDFILSREEKGFLDIRKDLPGYTVEKEDELIKKIFYIHDNNYQLQEKHKKLISSFFKYIDKNNSKRVFESIKELDS